MCGIIGYAGPSGSVKHLLAGLYALEYRGYDSAGVAVFNGEGKLEVVKASGRLCNVEEKLNARPDLASSGCGIGHTRWATHGAPSDVNSHPHGGPKLQLVHNGIIENHTILKQKLTGLGYSFISQTDTEAAAMLIDYHYCQTGDHMTAIELSVRELIGSFALGVVFADDPECIYAVRRDNPLIVGVGKGESFIASDITAILRYTKDYYRLEEGELAVVRRDSIKVYDLEGNPIEKELFSASWDIEAAEHGGYPHFMIKEINEEPEAIIKTLRPRINNGLPDFTGDKVDDEMLRNITRIYVVACGTAMNAGLYGKSLFEKLAGIAVNIEIASEFRYNNPIIGPGDLIMIISQSGETADSLAALRLAKQKGAYTLAVVNVVGSSIAREADNVIYTHAGPEIAVASTKAYTVQTALLALLAVHTAYLRNSMTRAYAENCVNDLLYRVPGAVAEVLARGEEILSAAREISTHENLFYIGRGTDYFLAQEGSLKLKEITYIHSEAYAAGELKHGTISLITKGVPVIAIATVDSVYDKMLSNIKEVKARGARVLTICRKSMSTESDIVIKLPEIPELFALIPAATVLQLLAYYTSVEKGCDVDKPRNLAKSVTVE
ncbi:MAG: glutamine--fructose-6-phosphate transaminase (isomerizing) [Eubacteriales bacterium]